MYKVLNKGNLAYNYTQSNIEIVKLPINKFEKLWIYIQL